MALPHPPTASDFYEYTVTSNVTFKIFLETNEIDSLSYMEIVCSSFMWLENERVASHWMGSPDFHFHELKDSGS